MYDDVLMHLRHIQFKMFERCVDIRYPLIKAFDAFARDDALEGYFWSGAVANVIMNVLATGQLGEKDGAPLLDLLLRKMKIGVDKQNGGG